jgi:archaellum biogenesis ATPase FlaH
VKANSDVDWLVEGLLPEGYLCLLAGQPKEGKTCLASALAEAVAQGASFAGMPTQQTNVIWLAQEESPAERYLFHKPNPAIQTRFGHFPIDQEANLDYLEYLADEHQAGLIVVDPLIAATSGRSLSSAWNARRSLQGLKNFCSETGITVIALHHMKTGTAKDRRPRVAESAQLMATASMSMVMQTEQLATERRITLYCSGRGAFANQTLRLFSRNPNHFERDETDFPTLGDQERQIIVCLSHRMATSAEIASGISGSLGSVRNSLTRLKLKGLVEPIAKDRGETVYALSPDGKGIENRIAKHA